MLLDFSAVEDQKNLLAFSAGVDSTALFFLLLENNISFDIVIVNYNLRAQSKEELAYAKELAYKYKKEIFIYETQLQSTSNFEKKARDIRYTFFEQIINKHKYKNLITAHQLNDKLEWFLMQLSKGAGLVELIGFNEFEKKQDYKIYKPLLDISRAELENFLLKNNYKYFIDESNFDEKYKRNFFRHNFSNKFIENFSSGIKKSFHYLQNDLNSMNIENNPLKKIEDLEIFTNSNDDNINIRTIDLSLKKRGILLSSANRNEILKQRKITVSGTINISILEDYIWIAPNYKISMDKKFKEKCRLAKIPTNIRAYLFYKNISLNSLVF